MAFNEDSRVKIPAILHLTRLGYSYLSLKNSMWTKPPTFSPISFVKASSASIPTPPRTTSPAHFRKFPFCSITRISAKPSTNDSSADSGLRLIDFENFDNNTFNVVTELPCKNGDDEFRPDITLLINGMPLFFTEVKKPNNRDGILAERHRINRRFKNPKFRRFVNITQLMVFSNNMKYD